MTDTQHSIRIPTDLWAWIVSEAKDNGYESPSDFIRFVLKKERAGSSISSAEERLVTTMSQIAKHVQSLGTMHQATFAVVWKQLEAFTAAFPTVHPTQASDQRLDELRVQIAGEVRGNTLMKGLRGEAEQT